MTDANTQALDSRRRRFSVRAELLVPRCLALLRPERLASVVSLGGVQASGPMRVIMKRWMRMKMQTMKSLSQVLVEQTRAPDACQQMLEKALHYATSPHAMRIRLRTGRRPKRSWVTVIPL